MWVYPCFDGDRDMVLAWIQHDLYFVSEARPNVHIDRYSTLGWIWAYAIHAAFLRRGHPWLDRNFERMQQILREGFNHKLLQLPHAHIAAYYRWTQPRIDRDPDRDGPYPPGLLEGWIAFLRKDIPELLSSENALVSLAKSIVYRQFEAGDTSYYQFQDILMRRYGYTCVSGCDWAKAIAERAGVPTTVDRKIA